MILLVLIFIMLGQSGQILAAGGETRQEVKKSCVNAVASASKDMAIAKAEIADLMIEKSRLTRSDETALRNLVSRNIQAKLAEFETYFSAAIDPGEMKVLIAEKEKAATGAGKKRVRREKKARRDEKDSKVDWGIKPVTTQKNILPIAARETLNDVKIINVAGAGTKITYEVRATSVEAGYHLYDLESKIDVYFGNHTGAVEYFKSAKEEIALTAPWAAEASQRVVQIHDIKSGRVIDSILLADLIPAFKSQTFYLGPQLHSYERADGSAGVIIAWATGNRMPYKIYDLDIKNKKMIELGETAGGVRFYAGPDKKSVYSVGVGPQERVSPNESLKAVTLNRWPENKTLYSDKMRFDSGNDGLFSTTEVTLHFGSDGKVYLGLSLYSIDKIVVADGSNTVLPDIAKPHTALGAGRFMQAGRQVFYLPKVGHDGHQVVYNIDAAQSETRDIGVTNSADLKGSVDVAKLGPYTVYETYNDQTKERFLILLPFANAELHTERFDLNFLALGQLHGTFTDSEGRIKGIFTVEDHRSGNTFYNFSLVQLYGTGDAR